MKFCVTFLLAVIFIQVAQAQYKFSGHTDAENVHNEVYLSLVEDYRKISGVFADQIIAKATTDNTGYFEFTGNQLDPKNHIYRLHIDHCNATEQSKNHFTGHCKESEEITFVAGNKDTIYFPLSGNYQMFCNIKASNPAVSGFFKVDSLIEIMKFEYAEYPSNASLKLNNKKWFHKIQDFGKSLNEPLAELYIYNFLSDRTNTLHDYYLEDLQTNSYYKELEKRLKINYAETPYLKQYETELNADLYALGISWQETLSPTLIILSILLFIALSGNILWFLKFRKKNKTVPATQADPLTKQEKSVLELILQDKTNKEIADLLFISLSTVKSHIHSIYKKLGVSSREAVKKKAVNNS